MADPLSIVAGVISITGAAIQVAKSLTDLATSVKNAPTEIAAIQEEAQAFYNLILSLEASLKDPNIVAIVQQDANMTRTVRDIKNPLDHCVDVLDKVEPKLRSHLKPTGDGNWRVSNMDVKWYFMKSDITGLLARLESRKATLFGALHLVVLACNFKGVGPQYGALPAQTKQRRPSDTDRDAGFALRQLAVSIAPHSPSFDSYFDKQMNLSENASAELTPWDSISNNMTDLALPKETPPKEVPPTALERLRKAEYLRAGLHNAAKDGDDLIVECMIEEGADVNIQAADGRTALHLAAEHGNEAAARILLEHGARPNVQQSTKGDLLNKKFNGGRTPLHWAAGMGHEGIVRLLIDHKADIGIQNATSRSALQEAIFQHHDRVAKLLIDCGAPLFETDDEDWTLLHQAAYQGRLEIIKVLISKGLDVEGRTADNTIGNLSMAKATPLLLVAHNSGSLPYCSIYLVDSGANITAENMSGNQSIHVACRRGYLPVVKVLLDAGANIEARDSVHNETPLLKAASRGKTDVISYLLHKGADTTARNSRERDALMHAKMHEPGKHSEAVALLEKWYEGKRQAQSSPQPPSLS